MSLQIQTPPASEPITLAQAKLHLRLDTDADDTLVTQLISAARTRAEWYTGRALITQGWTQWLDRWPQTNCVEIALPPLQNLTQIVFYGTDDTATDLDASLYQVDTASSPARVTLKPNATPPVDQRALNAVALIFTCGYGDEAEDVLPPIRAAILELIAFLYQHRGDAPAELPANIAATLAPYRIFKL